MTQLEERLAEGASIAEVVAEWGVKLQHGAEGDPGGADSRARQKNAVGGIAGFARAGARQRPARGRGLSLRRWDGATATLERLAASVGELIVASRRFCACGGHRQGRGSFGSSGADGAIVSEFVDLRNDRVAGGRRKPKLLRLYAQGATVADGCVRCLFLKVRRP